MAAAAVFCHLTKVTTATLSCAPRAVSKTESGNLQASMAAMTKAYGLDPDDI